MIDWVRVRREGRTKLICVPKHDVEDYLLIGKLPDAKTMSIYELPKHWTTGGVAYDFQSASFVFEILSPEFEQNTPGAQPETISATRHLIEITRKAVIT